MNTSEIICHASTQGISVRKSTFGIWNPVPTYSIFPANPHLGQYRNNMYHVTCNRSRSELLSGIRLMAERMKVELHGLPSR